MKKSQEEFTKSTFEDFQYVLRENFTSDAKLDEMILAQSIKSIFQLFQKKDYQDFKVEIESLDSEIIILKIVSDDCAFIIDSVINAIKKDTIDILYMTIPIFKVERDVGGYLKTFDNAAKDVQNLKNEAVSLFILRSHSKLDIESLKSKLEVILRCVFIVNKDWQIAKNLIKDLNEGFSQNNSQSHVKDLLEWLTQNNFIFLGTCIAEIQNNKIAYSDKTFSGFLRTDQYKIDDFVEPKILEDLNDNKDVSILFKKTTILSNVHRISNMEVIYIRVGGVLNILIGFFTSAVYHQNVMDIPIVNDKINDALIRHSHLEKTGYIIKELAVELQNYPRGELFRMSTDEIYDLTVCLISIILVPRVKIFVGDDHNSDFRSVLIFIPKDNFSMDLFGKIEAIVCEKMSVQSFKKYVHLSERSLMTIQLIVKIKEHIKYDLNAIEDAIASLTWTWQDLLKELLYKQYTHKITEDKLLIFNNAFDNTYVITNSVEQAVKDIANIKEMLAQQKDKLFKFIVTDTGCHFRIYSQSNKIEMSDLLPAIENTGFAVTDMTIHNIKPEYPNKSYLFYIHHLDVRPKYKVQLNKEHLVLNLEILLDNSLASSRVDQDKFNSLILYVGLSLQEVVICRVYARYLKQLAINYDIEFIIQTLADNPAITMNLVKLFNHKFSNLSMPTEQLQSGIQKIKAEILEGLTHIESAEADRVLRCYLEAIDATKRTNAFCSNGFEYISIKVASSEISFAPLPKPFMEIFVYATRFEGIHLRGGKVARGGIRWSDRFLDYRTEVLGLMKAQMTKNSVIVPVGSKGGFIVKTVQPHDREKFLQEGVECYKLFLKGLLDITDNFEGSEIIKTKNSACWDELDPYLVVAADKGTATFSDTANALALEYNFWLGDAFASGGSAGYDHKKLGITSRGAWISVLQHFNIFGINPHQQEITTIGIGDMSGDVFGNGMLMSDKIRLVAAFNHMHIFIDPTPDASKSFVERKRLFNQPRSQWSDYNQDLISNGGGIFLRSAKYIDLNDEIRNALGIDSTVKTMTPNELIRAILRAPVDLLWNGGIGTYVKSFIESNSQIGDKANDNLRINGKELMCKVVGEGGNLGFTQLGRIEYAQNGGCINTDAIDNSAGVDCSDHEVNLKIAFAPMIAEKKISLEERNAVLNEMSDEVCELVLKDNRLQTQILSIEAEQAKDQIWEHHWLIDYLEKQGELNREVEKLPSKEDSHQMILNNIPLTKPELCVLLAYAKNSAIRMLSECNEISSLFEIEPYRTLYYEYFPKKLREDKKYENYLLNHKLRNEILVTVLINDFINTMGCTYFHLMVGKQCIKPTTLIKEFCIVKYSLCIDSEWTMIENLKGEISGDAQLKLFKVMQLMISRNISWLNHSKVSDDKRHANEYSRIKSMVQHLISKVKYHHDHSDEGKLISHLLKEETIPEVLIPFVVSIQVSYFGLDIFFASKQYNINVENISSIYGQLRRKLKFDIINTRIAELFFSMKYDTKIAIMIVVRGLESLLMRIVASYIKLIGEDNVMTDNFENLSKVFENHSLENYLQFWDEIANDNSWSTDSDILSFLIILKKHLRMLSSSLLK
jgi:glutamate dehydrogenase